MSHLSDITRFKRSSLRQTDTVLTRPDGSQFIERRDQFGLSTYVAKDSSTEGFVVDLKPDLQVGRILPGLLLASADVAGDFSLLEELRVTHVLNVALSVTVETIRERYHYKHVPIADLPDISITDYFDKCFAFIDDGLSEGGCVLVHCMAGVSRSASIVIGYLMKSKSIDFQEAFDMVKEQRPSIRPNDGFLEQLKLYNVQCHVTFK